jgi:hypothetical protein
MKEILLDESIIDSAKLKRNLKMKKVSNNEPKHYSNKKVKLNSSFIDTSIQKNSSEKSKKNEGMRRKRNVI